jgi:hypothetical protein
VLVTIGLDRVSKNVTDDYIAEALREELGT